MKDKDIQPRSLDLTHWARQQARLWMLEGDRACLGRQFIKGLRYYQQALEVAEKHRLLDLQARLCRDLAYVYVHHGAADKALQVLDAAPAFHEVEPEIQIGLLVNRATALLALRDFRGSLATARKALGLIGEHYPRIEGTSSLAMVATSSALLRMAGKLERVMDLLEGGVNSERIQISVELTRPYWLPHEGFQW